MATKKTFEELLNRLESIVDEMENMDIGIEKAVKLYKEGVEISMQCFQNFNLLFYIFKPLRTLH